MNLFIQIENGDPKDHPISEENLRYFFPDLDINNPPEGFARFVRQQPRPLEPFEKVEYVQYVLDEELSAEHNTPVWTDKFAYRELTEEEMVIMADAETAAMNKKIQEAMGAPYPAPEDGNLYIWSPFVNKWVLKPEEFDALMCKFVAKLKEMSLSELTPEEIETMHPREKEAFQTIVEEINACVKAASR